MTRDDDDAPLDLGALAPGARWEERVERLAAEAPSLVPSRSSRRADVFGLAVAVAVVLLAWQLARERTLTRGEAGLALPGGEDAPHILLLGGAQ